MRPLHALTLITLCTATLAFAAPPAGVDGDWKTPTNSIVRVAPCSSTAANGKPDTCLTIVQLSPSAPETTDQQNPDATLRHRALCGLAVGTGFHATDPNHLADGHLYDPTSGHTYRGTITATGDTLQLRGYIGISLFGRSETWHRVPAVTACH